MQFQLNAGNHTVALAGQRGLAHDQDLPQLQWCQSDPHLELQRRQAWFVQAERILQLCQDRADALGQGIQSVPEHR
ncbi:hypothetical protein D3C84_856160 [compost metagenome]